MSTEQAWEMLREEEFGRLAFQLVDGLHIIPINFAVDGETLLFERPKAKSCSA
jgi:nitroimidazol reductase NimA-like FMN-containing flavoprotein (pyridoxamine 5'-phosphate oxidase superfamily)